MNETSRKRGYVGQAWLVILLALLYGGALAGVQTKLGPVIEQNKRNETYQRIPDLVGGVGEKQKIGIEERTVRRGDDKLQRVYQVFVDDALQGWVVPASGQGFADRIELLIGLNTDLSTITGLYVLNQKETPGLGNLITSDELFLNQFAGKSTEEPLVAVNTDPVAGSNQIRALTGATISSESVADIVNDAMDNLKGPIRRLAEAAPQNAGPETAAPGVNNIQQKDEN